MTARRLWIGQLALVLSLAAGNLLGNDPNPDRPKEPAKTSAKENGASVSETRKAIRAMKRPPIEALPAFSVEREAAALAFVNSQHPELAVLLAGLEVMNRSEYESAIRELFHESERLANLRERDPQFHALALERWKVDSRIELLVARLSQGASGDLDARLLEEVERQFDLEFQIKQLERDRLEAQLKKVDRTLSRWREQRGKLVSARVQKLLKTKPSQPPTPRVAAKEKPMP